MTDAFLDPNYEVPSSGRDSYMKLQEGDNKFRFLSRPIMGYKCWTDKKPLRFRTMNEAVRDGVEPIKHFWAMVVWDYTSKAIKILELTQKGIIKDITRLARDEDWGSPLHYDILINRKGEGMETEYQVIAKPKKELEKDIAEAYKNTSINLEALYEGKDPFKSEKEVIDTEDVADSIPF